MQYPHIAARAARRLATSLDRLADHKSRQGEKIEAIRLRKEAAKQWDRAAKFFAVSYPQ